MDIAINNFYERLVIDEIWRSLVKVNGIDDVNILQDIACLALNSLPPRYVRYTEDASFYISDIDREQMDIAVQGAVAKAYERVKNNPR